MGSFNAKKKNVKFESLTPRQNEILDALVDGLSYKMIADKLSISPNTTSDHIKAIYRKLQVNSKGEAISLALRRKQLLRVSGRVILILTKFLISFKIY